MKNLLTKIAIFSIILASLSLTVVSDAQATNCGKCDGTTTICSRNTDCIPNVVCVRTPALCGAGQTCSGSPSFICAAASVAPNRLDPWGAYSKGTVNEATLAANTGLGTTDPREMAANVVNVILGFLGIIAVILILAGGFMWMTAAGNEDKVGTAKKVMTAGVVGLVIVLAAFGIAKFVIGAFITATA